MAAVVAAVAAALWWWRVNRRQFGFFVLMVAMTILPWAVRNTLVFHQPVLMAPGAGMQLWLSMVDPQGRPEWDAAAPHMQEYQALVAGADSLEADRRLRTEGMRRILADPPGYLRLCLKRIPAFWLGGHSNTFVGLEQSLTAYLAQGDVWRVSLKLLMLAFNLGLIVLGAAGAYLAWRLKTTDPRSLGLVALPVVIKAVTHVFLFAALRYQVPIMSFLILFAAFAVCCLLGRLSRTVSTAP